MCFFLNKNLKKNISKINGEINFIFYVILIVVYID